MLLGVLVAPPSKGRAQDFDLSRDFSTDANPDGVWAYGWESLLGTGFTPVTFIGRGFADNGVAFDAWSIQKFVLPGFFHYPLSNQADGLAAGGAGVYPPGSFIFFPGESAPQNFAVVRFTAPSNGTYRVAAAVRHYLNGGPAGDTEFHVLSNGVSLLSRFMNPGDTSGYTNFLRLQAGATLDFATGRGEDGQLSGSGLLLQLVIDAGLVPFITQLPANVTVKAGATAQFHVVARSSNRVRYQWYFGEQPLAGETGSTLKIKPVRPEDAGPYTVSASNAAGTVWTAAVLTVTPGKGR